MGWLLVSLSLLHVVAGLSVRDELGTVVSRAAWPQWPQLRMHGLALLLTVLVTEVGFQQRIFLTTSPTVNQWLICAGVALLLLALEEAVKLVLRARHRPPAPAERGSPATTRRGSPVSSG